jgi:hypothetical protein
VTCFKVSWSSLFEERKPEITPVHDAGARFGHAGVNAGVDQQFPQITYPLRAHRLNRSSNLKFRTKLRLVDSARTWNGFEYVDKGAELPTTPFKKGTYPGGCRPSDPPRLGKPARFASCDTAAPEQ